MTLDSIQTEFFFTNDLFWKLPNFLAVSPNENHDGNASKAEHFLKENKLKNNVEPFYDYFNNDEAMIMMNALII